MRPLLKALKQFVQKRTLFFLPGNRDFLFSSYCHKIGGNILADGAALRLPGMSLLLYHGDTLFTADVRYHRMRAQLRKRWVYWLARLIHGSLCLKIGNRMRGMSRKEISRKTSQELQVDKDCIKRIFESTGAQVLICGHQHREEVISFPRDDESVSHAYVLPENKGLQLRYLLWEDGRLNFVDFDTGFVGLENSQK
jgi:UDP-2,3-diacylglucosamine hydrolase